MNVFGIDLLQLLIYVCVATSCIVVVYILKLTRAKNKTKTLPNPSEETFFNVTTLQTLDEIIKQLIVLIDKMYSHEVGLTPTSTSNPNPEPESPTTKEQTEKKPEPQAQKKSSARLSKVDEETYVSTEQDNELLERLKERLKEKG